MQFFGRIDVEAVIHRVVNWLAVVVDASAPRVVPQAEDRVLLLVNDDLWDRLTSILCHFEGRVDSQTGGSCTDDANTFLI